ncbi:hemerythrin domain-containing protein [Aurantimonas sp. VKM B-3413]|uniref:hemerythrin domain-containing protein n=1 Tax=Aurantimonas sp. VKM B-3413 TaxID=2779401 RepID=UPI001E37704C|nr:hemerythrin domain-containing protein [Aurantimonas sp. VKM B-3413]MCB8838582.1 hemerythrin domain-containing protein [Aurantimonas sp. VKM B-3413]
MGLRPFRSTAPSGCVALAVAAHSGVVPAICRTEPLSSRLENQLIIQEALCARLETLADRLALAVDAQHCLHLARSIYPILRRAHDFEERELFPLLRRQKGARADLSLTLDKLKFEHFEDEGSAEEVIQALIDFVCGGAAVDVESLRRRLQEFAQALRRHLAFERAVLLPRVLRIEEYGHA